MPANIKYNNVRGLDIYLLNDEYWDFMLFKGECYGISSGMSTDCLTSYIDTDNEACFSGQTMCSSIIWSGATISESGVTLEDIGLVGMDNGYISYDRDAMTPKKFLELFTGSTLNLNNGQFFLNPVTGNTKQYSYPIEKITESGHTYLKLTGGYYQGFFKLNGFDYQTLPSTIDSDWMFEFTIRPRSDYEAAENAVNKTHPENSGIFFYIGTRAENKFAEIYNGLYDNETSLSGLSPCNPIVASYTDCDEVPEGYVEDTSKQIDLLHSEIETSDGHSENEKGIFEIKTDNKYTFIEACYNIFDWERDGKPDVVLTGENREYIDNPFLLYNRTCTGYTVKDYYKITKPAGAGYDSDGNYNMNKDLYGNAFALVANADGSISYRYTIQDCDAESGYSTVSETTKAGLLKDGDWSTVVLKMHKMDAKYMKLYIYVNGYLIFISKQLPLLSLKGLNDTATKQEGVPYNISLGGGTQGLSERIWLNYYDIEKNVYELEKNYDGTFIGDFKSFKFYNCSMDLGTIKANYNYERNLWEK